MDNDQGKELFRKVFERGPIGLLLVGTDGRIQHVNRRFCEMLGYSAGEIVELGLARICHPDDWKRDQPFVSRLWRGEIPYYHVERRYLRKDGQVLWTDLTISLMHDEAGRPTNNIGMVADITERKQAEEARKEALRQSEEKYKGLVEACPDVVVVSDLNGKVLFASPQTWGLLGLPASEEMVGRSVFDCVIEGDRQRLAMNVPRLIETGVRRNTEYLALRQDGTTVPTETSSAVIRDAQGKPRAIMAVIRDISERKKAEAALDRERQTLKHLLQSSDHERQLIAYEIHDGLAQYLAGAIMQFDVYGHLKAAKPKEAARAYDAGMTMLRQGHFEARRLISGVRPPILDEAGIVAAVAHLANEQKLAGGPEIEFQGKVAFDRLVPVLENAVYRIVQEALMNACRHSNSRKIVVELVQHGDQLQVGVQDWGVGFYPKGVGEGCYGLEGIRERARLLGGQVEIVSVVGKGTRITVQLPVVLREKNE